MNRSLLPTVVAILFVFAPVISFGQNILIDDFDTGAGSVSVGPLVSESVELDISGIDPARTIGGERQIFIDDGQAVFIDSFIEVSGNQVSAFNAFGNAGYRWGQNTDLNLSLSQLDLAIASLESEFGFSTDISLTLTSGRNSANETTETVSRFEVPGQTDFIIAYDGNEFSNIDLSGVDFIQLDFLNDFLEVELESFSAVASVPEPTSASFMVGCLFLVTFKRRRS